MIQIHPATGILGFPACSTRGQSEHIRQDKIDCFVFHHNCTYLNLLRYLEFENELYTLALLKGARSPSKPKLSSDRMLSCVIRHITPQSQLLNPGVIRLPNQGPDHKKACGNVPFCTGPVTGTTSLVIIIIFKEMTGD